MKITFQNSSKYSKSFGDIEANHLPLYMGPQSSIDITPDAFLAFYDQFAKVTKIKREVDGSCRLLVTAPGQAPGEVSAEALLEGLVAGHLGEETQAKAIQFKAIREARREAELQAETERRAALRVA